MVLLPDADSSLLLFLRIFSGLFPRGSMPVLRARCDCEGADCPGDCKHSTCLWEQWRGSCPEWGEGAWKSGIQRGGLPAVSAAVFSCFCYSVSAAFNQSLFISVFFLLFLSILLPQLKEAEPKKSMPPETKLAEQAEQPPQARDAESAAQPNAEVSEVEIPSVGRILVRSDADGYDEEVQRWVRV